MDTLFLYNTPSRKLEAIRATQSDQILRVYCCGPTVYNFAHIGNFRTFLVQDLLHRLLLALGYSVRFVRNLTDVDDKTIRGACQQGISLKEFTEHWITVFHQDCQKLNILPPNTEPRATEHISEQIEMVQRLIDTGHAYVTADGSVYFKLASCPSYGKVSGITLEQLQTQDQNSAGIHNQADEYDREHIHDFALWKAHKEEDGEVYWESPWGKGRPGWHIECSAMSKKYLGETIDIHGGGMDLCFPHHENEVAQTESVTGKSFVKHWFHSAHLQVGGQKMSKSLGNLYTLADLEKKGYDALTVRYALISGHYRQVLNFTLSSLEAAQSALHKIQARLEGYDFSAFSGTDKLISKNQTTIANLSVLGNPEQWIYFGLAIKALLEDLNVPKCLGALFTALKTDVTDEIFYKELATLLWILGLDPLLSQKAIQDKTVAKVPQEISELAEARKLAKQEKRYADADVIRQKITELGWVIQDNKEGYTLSKN